MVYLIKTFIGIFALGEDKEVISFKPFPKDANVIATKLMEEEPKELQQIKNELKNKQFITDKEVENFDDKQLNQFREKSFGMDFNDEDINAVRLFASNIIKLYGLREEFTNYLSKLLKEIAPNFSALAGDNIAARLIAKTGGIERLARLPSSTIQLLGSEKALFRFLKSKGKSRSPKYGLIYNHPLIQNSPKEKQGKIARLLASKLSIAARIDYYSKEYKADGMKKELEIKVKEILNSKK